MTIRPSSASPSSPVGPASADAAQAENRPADARAAAPAAAGDRVELSAAARAQAAAAAEAAQPEIASARHALRAEDALSPARLHELRQRARSGHYDTPSAVERVAEAAARDLSAGTGLPGRPGPEGS